MNNLVKLLITIALCCAAHVSAEVVVIAHPSNADSINDNALSRIFLGKSKTFPGGSQAIPINQAAASAVTAEFNQKVLKKSASQLKAYWSKLVFTGKANPPKEVANDVEVVELVGSNPNVIGYVNASAVTEAVKVVAKY